MRIGGVVAATAIVDIGALDCATGELLGGVDDAAEHMSVVGIARQHLGVEHEPTAGAVGIGGDDRGFDAELEGRAGLAPCRCIRPRGARQRPFQYGLEIGLADDFATDIRMRRPSRVRSRRNWR